MEMYYLLFRRSSVYLTSLRSYASYGSPSINLSRTKINDSSFSINNSLHCYRTLYPWKNFEEFSRYLISSIEYSKGGLLVLNKPFGIKIHGHDEPDASPKSDIQFIKPSVPTCDYTIEDSLPELRKYFDLPNLAIVKSAEKYSSGIVLLSSSDKVTAKLRKSFNIAKTQKKPHLVHWAVTVGYPVVPYRKERVGIKFVEVDDKMRQAVIVTDFSKRASKQKIVHPVNVESRIVSMNEQLSTSLVEIASSSVTHYFVRVYASSRLAPILGDILYGWRMKKFLGIPVKVQLQNVLGTGFEPLNPKMSEVLNIPKGMAGQLMVPNMLHLRSIVLPNYHEKDKDFIVTASLPPHFKYTVNRLNLMCDK